MMYYSEEVVEEVRSRSDILDVISSCVKLKRSGSSWVGLCPFHGEKTPSFYVTPAKQMFYCFGCHRGGSVFTFVEMYENYSFPEAVKYLADRAGIALPEEEATPEQRRLQEFRSGLFNVNRLAGTYYYYFLRSAGGADGMRYLKGRELTDETMKQFGLGYAGKRSDGLRLYLKQKGISEELMRASGLMNVDEKRGMYDRFWNRVMFPIMDVNNRIIGFGGRVMGDAKPKYLNSPETDIFNKRRNLYGLNVARRTRESFLILCEGYMDVIALHQAGFTNAVASLGTSLTEEHAVLLRRYTQEVILSYDSDSAGVNAALRAIPMLKANDISVRILSLSPYKDPDEFLKALGPEALRERLSQAKNSFFFELDVLQSQFDLHDPEARTRFQMQTASRIASFELEAERENYISAVAERYHMSFEGLRQMVNRVLTAGAPKKSAAPRPASSAKVTERGEEALTSQRLLLTWLTAYPGFFAAVKPYISPEDFAPGFYQETAKLLYAQLEAGELNEAAIVDHFQDSEDQKRIARLFHARVPVESQEALKKAMRETIRKVWDQAAMQGQGDAERKDLGDLQSMIEKKRRLQEIDRLQIDLGGGED